jgi:hypothetical protein
LAQLFGIVDIDSGVGLFGSTFHVLAAGREADGHAKGKEEGCEKTFGGHMAMIL